MTTQRLLLLDTASLYFRAFFGVPDSMRAPDGRPVNAVRGLLDFIARLTEDYRPTHLACCWDNDWRPAWRVELIPSYKAHRVAEPTGSGIGEMSHSDETEIEESPDALAVQVPMIIDVLGALGLAVVGKDGYEADDVIGTLARTSGIPTEVVTGDRDLFQLVDDQRQIRVLYIARGVGKHDRVDDAWIRNRFGVPAADYRDFATLKGDPSDGLPGVAGVGEKTAAQLITKYGTIEGILAAASEPKSVIAPGVRAKLAAAIDYLAVAPEVVGVVDNLDLGVRLDDLALPSAPADPDRFADLTADLGLGGSADRVLAALKAS
ncbi:5'-3' exonuclease [Microlunatus elymi]|uniref:5'-3' exonuclease n=1 Tax=Microlunatus elymi TaxID=2596828 RepID=A0A516Q0F5_9ACTN|nr:5'-3' exonuclease [Microlunatus elymi]QDP96877.1 5'-3' exonuclease [Microlunatus elymi]